MFAVVERVSVEEPFAGFGEKTAVLFAGSPLALRATVSVKPPVGVMTTL